MAKGRKLTIGHGERFFGYSQHGHVPGNESPELREDEVWSMADETAGGEWEPYSPGGNWTARASSDVESFRPPPRVNHRRRRVGGLSLAFEDSEDSSPRIVHQFRAPESTAESPRGRYVATSAPVNIPDWSKIYPVEVDSDDGLNEEPGVVPPHEYLARSRKTAANSVYEGAGRTLKGRDLSRVRDAVWSRTGFYG